MKLFLTIFTIALVAQVSFGASIQRAKRDADDSSPNAIEFMKDTMSVLRNKLEAAYTEMPDTAAYASYIRKIEDLIETIEENKGDLCFVKFGKLGEKLTIFGDEIEKDNSEQSMVINEIFGSYFDEEFLEKFENDIKNMKKPTAQEVMETC